MYLLRDSTWSVWGVQVIKILSPRGAQELLYHSAFHNHSVFFCSNMVNSLFLEENRFEQRLKRIDFGHSLLQDGRNKWKTDFIFCKHFPQFPETSTLEKYRVTSLLCLPLISRGFKELFSCPFSRGAYPYSNAVLSHFTCTLWDLPKVPPAKAIQPAIFQPQTTIPPVSSCDHPDDPVIPIISWSQVWSYHSSLHLGDKCTRRPYKLPS